MIDNLWTREQEFINTINLMECRGVRIDTQMSRRKIAIGESTMHTIKRDIGANPGSPKDLKRLLLDELKLPVVKRSANTGAPSFDKEAMKEYDLILEHRGSDLAQKIVAYRGWQNATAFYKGFLEHLSPDGRLRTNYWIHGTLTSRLSSRGPNLQNIPKSQEDAAKKPWSGDMKEAFLPLDYPEPTWGLLNVDMSQLELRLAVAYSREPKLLEILNDPNPKRKIFAEMAAEMGYDYNTIKTWMYASLYGAQYKKIGQILGLGPDESMAMHEKFMNTYPLLMEFPSVVRSKALSRGYIKYWSGRRRHLAHPNDANKMFNSLLQGGGAEIVKSAMIRVKNRVDRDGYYRMLLQVHDSIVGEARMSEIEEIKAAVIREMSNVSEEYDFGLRFSAEADFWGPKMELAA